MKQRKQVLFVVVVVMLAVIALSVNTALAGDFDKAITPSSIHTPVCAKSAPFAPNGAYTLECNDAGHDIVSVVVKSDLKYELVWDQNHVYLRVFISEYDGGAYYVIRDKAGSIVAGRLP